MDEVNSLSNYLARPSVGIVSMFCCFKAKSLFGTLKWNGGFDIIQAMTDSKKIPQLSSVILSRRDFGKIGIGALLSGYWSETMMAHTGLQQGKYLDLPSGFSVKMISRTGDRLGDGFRTPGLPDGMGCFMGRGGEWVLMCNHELLSSHSKVSPYYFQQDVPDLAYDPLEIGGVSRLVLDPDDLHVKRSHMALLGTSRNCAGGISPWGWLTCEETFHSNAGVDHGFVFLCSHLFEGLNKPEPIRAYGRFNHEAAVVDGKSSVAYLSEDRADGCLYRFLPSNPQRPFDGKLQVLGLAEPVNKKDAMLEGETVACRWLDLPRVDTKQDRLRHIAKSLGAITFVRGEGLWLDGSDLYLSTTAGGRNNKGQIWRFSPAGDGVNKGQLKLVIQPDDSRELDMPDNITVGPNGSLFIAEDGSGEQYIRLLKQNGNLSSFAKNSYSGSEITGVCFSPDYSTLFCNLQHDGITLAIRGPFNKFCSA